MSQSSEEDVVQAMQDWWKTNIIDMQPGVIRYSGYAVEDLIGQVSFAQMAWLLTRGELPDKAQADLLEAALVAGVDHGPQAPSIAIARMAATCGVGINNAMASAVNVLGDVHGGAGEQAVTLYHQIMQHAQEARQPLNAACNDILPDWLAEHHFVPGFGHRFHPVDPRAPRLLALVDDAAKQGTVSGDFAQCARVVEDWLYAHKGRRIPMNIDGASAVIYAELGFAPTLARGLFCISRSVGILAHAWEQSQEGQRNKGPIPRQYIWNYTGTPSRDLPEEQAGEQP